MYHCPRCLNAIQRHEVWSRLERPFDGPIRLPRGRQLVTLEDAGNYITKLPKAEHEAAERQPAMEALIPVATSGGPTMFARIGVMRALNCHVEVRSMLAFVFRLVYQLFCRKYFAVLPKYRRLHDRWA